MPPGRVAAGEGLLAGSEQGGDASSAYNRVALTHRIGTATCQY